MNGKKADVMSNQYKKFNRKKRIMIVDDSSAHRGLLADILKREYEIVEVESGKQAIAYLKEHGPEVSWSCWIRLCRIWMDLKYWRL